MLRQTEFTVQWFHETNCPARTRKTCGIYLIIQSRGIMSQHEMVLISNPKPCLDTNKSLTCTIVRRLVNMFPDYYTHKKLKMTVTQKNRLHTTYMKETYRLLGEG